MALVWSQLGKNANAQATGTTIFKAYQTSNLTVGSLLVAPVYVSGSRTITGVSDGTQTWSKAIGPITNPAGYSIYIWYFLNNQLSTKPTVTASLDASGNAGIFLFEGTGFLTPSGMALDKTASGTTTGTNPTTGSSGALTAAGELAICAGIVNSSSALTPGSGWTGDNASLPFGEWFSDEFQVTPDASAIVGNFTSVSVPYALALATFMDGAVVGGNNDDYIIHARRIGRR